MAHLSLILIYTIEILDSGSRLVFFSELIFLIIVSFKFIFYILPVVAFMGIYLINKISTSIDVIFNSKVDASSEFRFKSMIYSIDSWLSELSTFLFGVPYNHYLKMDPYPVGDHNAFTLFISNYGVFSFVAIVAILLVPVILYKLIYNKNKIDRTAHIFNIGYLIMLATLLFSPIQSQFWGYYCLLMVYCLVILKEKNNA